MLGTTNRQRRMVSLGKVTAPKPVNLPSQKKENNGNDPNLNLVSKGSGWGSDSTTLPPPSSASSHDETSSKLPPRVLPAQPGPAWGGAGLPEERRRALEIASREQFPSLGTHVPDAESSREHSVSDRRGSFAEYNARPRSPISGRGVWDEDERGHYSFPPFERDRGSPYGRSSSGGGYYHPHSRYGRDVPQFPRYEDDADEFGVPPRERYSREYSPYGGYRGDERSGTDATRPSMHQESAQFGDRDDFEDRDSPMIPPPPPRGAMGRHMDHPTGRTQQHRYPDRDRFGREYLPRGTPPSYGHRFAEREIHEDVQHREPGDGAYPPHPSGAEPPTGGKVPEDSTADGAHSRERPRSRRHVDEPHSEGESLVDGVHGGGYGAMSQRPGAPMGGKFPPKRPSDMGRYGSERAHHPAAAYHERRHVAVDERDSREEETMEISAGAPDSPPPPPPPPPPPRRQTDEDTHGSKSIAMLSRANLTFEDRVGSGMSGFEEDALSSTTAYSHNATIGSSAAPTLRSEYGILDDVSAVDSLPDTEERQYGLKEETQNGKPTVSQRRRFEKRETQAGKGTYASRVASQATGTNGSVSTSRPTSQRDSTGGVKSSQKTAPAAKQQPMRILKRGDAPGFALPNAGASLSEKPDQEAASSHPQQGPDSQQLPSEGRTLLDISQTFAMKDAARESKSDAVKSSSSRSENRAGIFLSSLPDAAFMDHFSTTGGSSHERDGAEQDRAFAPSLQGLSLQPSVFLLSRTDERGEDGKDGKGVPTSASESSTFEHGGALFLPHATSGSDHQMPLMGFDSTTSNGGHDGMAGHASAPMSTSGLTSISGGHALTPSLPLGIALSQEGGSGMMLNDSRSLGPPPLQFGDILLPSTIDGSVEPGETPPRDVSLLGRDLGAAIGSAGGDTPRNVASASKHSAGRTTLSKASGRGGRPGGKKGPRQAGKYGAMEDKKSSSELQKGRPGWDDAMRRGGRQQRQEQHRGGKRDLKPAKSAGNRPPPPPPPPGLKSNCSESREAQESSGEGGVPPPPPPPRMHAADKNGSGSGEGHRTSTSVVTVSKGERSSENASKDETAGSTKKKPGQRSIALQSKRRVAPSGVRFSKETSSGKGNSTNHGSNPSVEGEKEDESLGDGSKKPRETSKSKSGSKVESPEEYEDEATPNGVHSGKHVSQRQRRRGRGKPRGRGEKSSDANGASFERDHRREQGGNDPSAPTMKEDSRTKIVQVSSSHRSSSGFSGGGRRGRGNGVSSSARQGGRHGGGGGQSEADVEKTAAG